MHFPQKRHFTCVILCFAVLQFVVVEPTLVTPTARGSEPANLQIFDGTPKVFVVNGYSTSFHWPKILQQKLDRYFGGKRIIEVIPVTKGGTPIAKWMNIETGERSPAWNDILKREL